MRAPLRRMNPSARNCARDRLPTPPRRVSRIPHHILTQSRCSYELRTVIEILPESCPPPKMYLKQQAHLPGRRLLGASGKSVFESRPLCCMPRDLDFLRYLRTTTEMRLDE